MWSSAIRPKNDAGPTPSRKVVMEKLSDGEEAITITIRAIRWAAMRGRLKDRFQLTTTENESQPLLTRSRRSDRHGRPEQVTQSHSQTTPRAGPTTTRGSPTTRRAGQTVPSQNRAPRMVKSRSLEADEWKVNEGRNKKPTFKPTFDYLLNKYTKAGPKDRAMKRPRSPMRQERQERPKQTKPKAKKKWSCRRRI
jgi:hypothetical protein